MAELFRKSALDNMSTPEQLDKQVKIVRPSAWIIGVILILGLITMTVWSLTYHMSNSINMRGVVFTNTDIESIKSDRNCVITDILVKEGDIVELGDVIAAVSCDDLLNEIYEKEQALELLDKNSKEYKLRSGELENMRDAYIAKTVIKSTNTGYVQSVKSIGTALEPGESICSIMLYNGYKQIVAYVPMQTAQNLEIGMKSQISPDYAPREEYGYMTGTITRISDAPATKESIISKMGTLSYVEDILPDSACVEVDIKLDMNSESPNEYQWSNPKGEKLSVGLGTICSIIAVTDEYKPIELLF